MKDSEIEELPFTGWPIPDSYLVEIGRITVLWSSLEALLNLCLGKLAGFEEGDPKPFILVNHTSFPQRLDMLGALCEHLAPNHPNLSDYKVVIGKLRTAQRERNKYAHYGLGPDEEGRITMAVGSARGSIKTTVKPVTIADIRRAVMVVDEATAALYKLVLKRDIGPAWKRRQKTLRS
jgi:hypothetical protein